MNKKYLNLRISSLRLINLCEKKETVRIKKEKEELNYWLINQKDSHWVFDKDLTLNFLAITALFKNNPQQISGQDIAKILKILTDCEQKVGGPYINRAKQKIDLTANIIIAYFLFLNNINLPNLDKLINKNIKIINNNRKSLDYLLLSKFYKKESLEKRTNDKGDKIITKKIIVEAKKRFKSLKIEFRKIALMEIKKTIKKNKDKQMSLISYYFKKALGDKGNNISEDFVIKAGLANIFYWTAFIIYDDFWDEDEQALPKILPTANLYARNYIDFYTHINSGDINFKNYFHHIMDKLDQANTWEVLHCRTTINNSKFIIPEKLPDYGNYSIKFYPAAGQILGPLTMLSMIGFKVDSKEALNLICYFKNYLIAMQINDDAHDYIEDMERGHLSTVVVMLLKDWQEKYPEKKEIDLVSDLKQLQELFWFKTIKTACELAIYYTNKSRKALTKLYFLENSVPLANFINIAENVAKAALNERRKSLDFLKEFK